METNHLVDLTLPPEDLLEDFADALADRVPEIERSVARLTEQPSSREITDDLFRAIHNIKGDAMLCKFPLGTAIAHPIESVMSRFREGKVAFGKMLAESILLAIDRLELATDALQAGKSLEHLHLDDLIAGLNEIASAAPQLVDAKCIRLIGKITGFPPRTFNAEAQLQTPLPKVPENKIRDLQFFRLLAEQFENRSPLFSGRTDRILRLALETNRLAGNSVDPLQLEAAVFMHDIGMMFLPESIWLNRVGQMSEEEKSLLQKHPSYAAGILQRMQGWEVAALMVAQHHEMPGGSGYPLKLKKEKIIDGAKILSIVDAFEAMMLKHSHRGKNRSVLRAIAEINAGDQQFATEWILPFNAVIRKTVEA